MTTNADKVIRSLQSELDEIAKDIQCFRAYGLYELEGQALTRRYELQVYLTALTKLDHSPTAATTSPTVELPVTAR